MNKLFVILLTGAYIPWCMMLLFYLWDWKYLISFLRRSICVASPNGATRQAQRDFWNRMFRVMEMCLVARIIVINMIGSAHWRLPVDCRVVRDSEDEADMQKIATEAPIYCMSVIFDVVNTVTSSPCGVRRADFFLVLPVEIQSYVRECVHHEEKSYDSLPLKIVEAYMVFY